MPKQSEAKKCDGKMEVYSRVCGYCRPVNNWNLGKQEEFHDRLVFDVAKAGKPRSQE